MRILYLIASFFVFLTCSAVNTDIQLVVDSVYTIETVDVKPEFVGGTPALISFLSEKLVYPTNAKSRRIEGQIFMSFIVEKNGELSTVRVTESVYPQLDEEAYRLVKIMPAWIPAEKNGVKVRVKVKLPITFKLHK